MQRVGEDGCLLGAGAVNTLHNAAEPTRQLPRHGKSQRRVFQKSCLQVWKASLEHLGIPGRYGRYGNHSPTAISVNARPCCVILSWLIVLVGGSCVYGEVRLTLPFLPVLAFLSMVRLLRECKREERRGKW